MRSKVTTAFHAPVQLVKGKSLYMSQIAIRSALIPVSVGCGMPAIAGLLPALSSLAPIHTPEWRRAL